MPPAIVDLTFMRKFYCTGCSQKVIDDPNREVRRLYEVGLIHRVIEISELVY